MGARWTENPTSSTSQKITPSLHHAQYSTQEKRLHYEVAVCPRRLVEQREQEIEQTELDATNYAAYTQAKRKREINGKSNVIT